MSTIGTRAWPRLPRELRRAIGQSVLQLSLISCSALGAVKERYYPLGEGDEGAAIGGQVLSTEDILDSPSDGAGSLVPLTAFTDSEAPTYVEGRDGPGSLAVEFDGIDDRLESPAFDPRHFGGSFAALSQAWVWPDASGSGTDQAIWNLGTDNGGVGISADGFWQLRSVAIVPDTVTDEAVVFDRWTHVAVLRTGGGASLFIDGARIVNLEGFWNGPGDVSVGADPLSEFPFRGKLDDFNLAGFSDGVFDLVSDLDFFDPDNFSGVLGDVDQDGLVGESDYLIWSGNVGFDNGQGAGDVTTLLMGDVNEDGRINYFDFQIISTEAAVAGAALNLVPEPASTTLLAIGALVTASVLRRERRPRA
jgi:hypothetical protein